MPDDVIIHNVIYDNHVITIVTLVKPRMPKRYWVKPSLQARLSSDMLKYLDEDDLTLSKTPVGS